MSYHIYNTRGIVLAEKPAREADRIYTIFTRDLGLLRASATGVRKNLSKLRGHIEPFSIVDVSLVRGREYWRLTSAELATDLKTLLVEDPELFLAFAKNLSLLEKLVAGEEKHAKLFDDLISLIKFAVRRRPITKDLESLEILIALKILFHLGYLSGEDLPNKVLGSEPDDEVLTMVLAQKKSLIKAINHGIDSSQLG